MLRGLFKRDNDTELQREKQYVLEGQDEEVEEAISLLSQEGGRLDETMNEINEAVKDAAKSSLRDIRLMEDVTGRGHSHVDLTPSSAVYVLLTD